MHSSSLLGLLKEFRGQNLQNFEPSVSFVTDEDEFESLAKSTLPIINIYKEPNDVHSKEYKDTFEILQKSSSKRFSLLDVESLQGTTRGKKSFAPFLKKHISKYFFNPIKPGVWGGGINPSVRRSPGKFLS